MYPVYVQTANAELLMLTKFYIFTSSVFFYPSELFPHTGASEIIDNIALATIAIAHVIIWNRFFYNVDNVNIETKLLLKRLLMKKDVLLIKTLLSTMFQTIWVTIRKTLISKSSLLETLLSKTLLFEAIGLEIYSPPVSFSINSPPEYIFIADNYFL